MPIPGPGVAISINTIATEFGGTTPHSLSEYYRGGGLVPNTPVNNAIPTSGQIAIGDFYGSSNVSALALTISANTQNYDVYTAAVGAGYSSGDVSVTINPGVVVGSNSTGAYALLVPSAFSPTASISITNNGTIIGAGGNGGPSGKATSGTQAGFPGTPGGTGGNAVYANRPITITNNGVIAGGGGGGGGGGGNSAPRFATGNARSGGGGGGGAGNTAGAGGGVTGTSSGSGSPGSPGTLTAGGSGGAGQAGTYPGGPGGGQGASGTAGVPGPAQSGGSGGVGGNYIVGNPFVTWNAIGTVLGGVA